MKRYHIFFSVSFFTNQWCPIHSGHITTTVVLLDLLAAGCASTINTLPSVTNNEDPVEELTLYVPDGLEINSVDYNATLYSNVSGSTYVGTKLGGRAFVKVYATHRETGVQYLLLYENFAERSRPIQIIRFEPDMMSDNKASN